MKNNEVTVFNNDTFGNLRIVEVDGDPWFVAKDVCDALVIANSRDALSSLDEDEKGVAITDTLGGRQKLQIVNEPGLYSLTFKSRKKEAKDFKRWVTHEVLPSIRKHGMYATEAAVEKFLAHPDALLHTLEALKAERERTRALEAKAELNAPKVIFADAVATSKTSILIGDLAKLLKQNGVDTGQKRLFARLREEGYLHKGGSSKNMPTQKAMELGLFEVKERTIDNPDGHILVTRTTKVTGKGQQFFINYFLKRVA